MKITYGPGAQSTILAPQLQWHRVNQDYQICLVAGFELTVIKEGVGESTYEMLYCQHRVRGINSMKEAKGLAPEFARQVLQMLIDTID